MIPLWPSQRPSKKKLLIQAVTVSALLRTLSHPQRLCILCHLSEGELSVNEIAERCDISQPQASQFLARMRTEGLIASQREGRTVRYHIADPRVKELMTAMANILCSGNKKGD